VFWLGASPGRLAEIYRTHTPPPEIAEPPNDAASALRLVLDDLMKLNRNEKAIAAPAPDRNHHTASILMTVALRGQSLRRSWHTGLASRFLSKSFCRLLSVDHRLSLPSYQPVILASVLDRRVMQYICL
jgi:hypothetical protein